MNLEEDVNILINFTHEATVGMEPDLAELFSQVVESHGAREVLENLKSRNRTPVINALVEVLRETYSENSIL
jgi:alanine-alpha-ketoisovalerate/valine-pyruvate aminotransferase